MARIWSLAFQDVKITLLLLLSYAISVSAFNVEQRVPMLKYGPEGSLFGLSVAQHHISPFNSDPGNAVLLVGAPTADPAPEQSQNIYKPGGFFKCPISMDDNCNRVVIIPKANGQNTNSSNQWLGVAVKSQKPGGKIAVCAHRYTLTGGSQPSRAWEAALGRCFMLENNVVPVRARLSFEYVPCLGLQDRKGAYTHELFGYCQAGTAVDFAHIVASGKDEVVMGAPGSFVWSGAFKTSHLNPDLLGTNANLWSQEEADADSPIRKNSLLGSSLASGQLLGSTMNYVAGAPGANSTGAVVIFQKAVQGNDEKLQAVQVIYGDKIASRFGQEVQLVDVTGDGRLDLIVGAPQYYDREKKLGGAVYIYVNKGLDEIGPEPDEILYGKVDSSFGISITGLADINMDGANDIAIGAPGEDIWKGAIYIFNGNNGDATKGVHENPSQVIRASDLTGVKKNITGMGYSLSGGLDMDFNGYPDVAVGTLSDAVIMFQSRPVVNVFGRISGPAKHIVLSKDSRKQRFNVTICLNYTAIPPSFNDEVKVTCTVKLDTARLDTDLPPRVTFSKDDTTEAMKNLNMTLYPQSQQRDKCSDLAVYLNDDIQDKLSPIKLELSFNTRNLQPRRKRRQTAPPIPTPIMNAAIENTAVTEMKFAKACGDDDICKSNLSMTAFYEVLRDEEWTELGKNEDETPVLKLGTEKQIGMVIHVQNQLPGEDAHQATLEIYLPQVLQYRSIQKINGSAADVHCDTKADNQTFVICSLGNPFKSESDLRFRFKLSKNKSIYQATGFIVKLQLHTTSQQPDHNIIREYPVIVQVEAQLTVSGYPSKEQVQFGGDVTGESAVKQPTDAGNLHSHYYEVTNTGTGPAENVKLHIKWPQNINNGKWLFYLLQSNVRDGEGNCSLPDTVNPLGLKYASVHRAKRDSETGESGMRAPVLKKSIKPPDSPFEQLDCSSAKCVEFECSLGTIKPLATRYIELHAILWNSTFLEEYRGVSEVQVQSAARVTIAQKNIKFSDLSKLNSTISTSVLSETLPTPEEVKWWIIVAASVAGLILLVCLVLILWKCGFFKRRKFGDYQKARRHKQASKKAEERERESLY